MKAFLFSRTGIVLFGFLMVAGFFVWEEHKAHAIEYLPWVLLALCPVMHLFMHHGRHGSKTDGSGSHQLERDQENSDG